MKARMGVFGLGVMGGGLARNLARRGIPVAVYNRSWERTERFLREHVRTEPVTAARTVEGFLDALERPRRILLMVPAGAPVDEVLALLVPHLEAGDLVVDGGNSHFQDTERRQAALAARGIHGIGLGVSGGEAGALQGPSLMPGGPREPYREHLHGLLARIAARADTGPCVAYLGRGGAGHFVKMVHNGIEYAELQCLAEAYDLLRAGLGLSAAEAAAEFAAWNAGELGSFLMELAARVTARRDADGAPLVDRILDVAREKGTGRWSVQAALELGVAVPSLVAGVEARQLSVRKELRTRAAAVYREPAPPAGAREPLRAALPAALYAARIVNLAQGFDLLRAANGAYGYAIPLAEVARIWKGGCILRARVLEAVRRAYAEGPGLEHLLLQRGIAGEVAVRLPAWRRVVEWAVATGRTPPALGAGLAYLDALRRERLPANLIQALRDAFGAHGYERLDREGRFHTAWLAEG